MSYARGYIAAYFICAILVFSTAMKSLASDCAEKLHAASWMLDVAECLQIIQKENEEMKKRIKKLEDTIGTSKPKRTIAPRAAQMKMEVKQFVFDLHKCGLSGQTLKCSFTITNTGKDRNFGINSNTHAYDDIGEPHKLTQATGRGLNGGKRPTITGIPMPLNLTFDGFPKETSYIPRLVLKSFHFGTLTFRDVPITE